MTKRVSCRRGEKEIYVSPSPTEFAIRCYWQKAMFPSHKNVFPFDGMVTLSSSGFWRMQTSW